MPGAREIGLGLLLPALLCGVLLLLAWRSPSERLRAAAAGPAFGLAWFAACVAWSGLPAWPSADRTPAAKDWLAWMALLAGLCPDRIARIARPLFSAALAYLLLHARAERTGSWNGVVLAAAATFLAWIGVDRWTRRVTGPRAPLALLVAATGVSLACLFVHSALVASLAGALAACLGAATVVAFLDRGFRLDAGATRVVVIVLAGSLASALAFSFPPLPAASAVLLGASALAPGLLDLRRRGEPGARGGWVEAIAAAGLALAPAALAVWIAWTPGEEDLGRRLPLPGQVPGDRVAGRQHRVERDDEGGDRAFRGDLRAAGLPDHAVADHARGQLDLDLERRADRLRLPARVERAGDALALLLGERREGLRPAYVRPAREDDLDEPDPGAALAGGEGDVGDLQLREIDEAPAGAHHLDAAAPGRPLARLLDGAAPAREDEAARPERPREVVPQAHAHGDDVAFVAGGEGEKKSGEDGDRRSDHGGPPGQGDRAGV
jgi:hypothetical protein